MLGTLALKQSKKWWLEITGGMIQSVNHQLYMATIHKNNMELPCIGEQHEVQWEKLAFLFQVCWSSGQKGIESGKQTGYYSWWFPIVFILSLMSVLSRRGKERNWCSSKCLFWQGLHRLVLCQTPNYFSGHSMVFIWDLGGGGGAPCSESSRKKNKPKQNVSQAGHGEGCGPSANEHCVSSVGWKEWTRNKTEGLKT